MTSIYNCIRKNDFNSAWNCLSLINNAQELEELYKSPFPKSENVLEQVLKRPLNQASKNFLDEFIAKSIDYNIMDLFEKNKPFLFALNSKHPKNFEYLLKKYDKYFTDLDQIKNCLQHLIIQNQFLLSKEVLNLKDKNISMLAKDFPSFLKESINHNHPEIFEEFFKTILKYNETAKIKINLLENFCDTKENILFFISRKNNGFEFFKILTNQKYPFLKELFAHINDQNANKETALHLSAKNGNQKLTEELLCYGLNWEIKDQNKKTPLDEAKNTAIEVLKNARLGFVNPIKDIPEKLLKEFQERQKNCLMRSCEMGQIQNAKFLINTYKVDPTIIREKDGFSLIMMLLEGIWYGNVRNAFRGNTPDRKQLQLNLEKSIISLIIALNNDKKIDFSHINNDGNNFLMLSLIYKFTEIPFFLLQNYSHSFPIDQKNNKGETALQIAMQNDDISVAKKIVEILNKKFK